MPKGARNSDAMYGISHVDTKWVVILRRNKQQFSKSFSHITYGSPEAALAAARAWRDETVRLHPPALKRERSERIISTNKSGVAGVRCRLGPDGKPQLWMAQTRIGSQTLLKSFSVGRYGKQAKLLAIAERQKHLDLVKGRASRHPADNVDPTAPPVPPELWLTKRITKAEVVRRNNKTGMPGVFCRSDSDGQPRAWIARTRSNGETIYKEFLVKEHGGQLARELAIAERRKQLEQTGHFAQMHRAEETVRDSRTAA
ncbi:AP2 domain-containing protein [Variovorax sp. DXTD-1]|uniref:AP2 domain-containing protein n=1 Tax=Variovorax sp. DXTD-1 TaxID=2495592 RepID=UPI000F884291|nr:AP2 domain-containing protein [Variovorax sp. DXTD-1]RST54044.1 AP2 domain-containing protein [Variovorax sp. DXTD-1]